MTSPPVSSPTPREQTLIALADELTPAKSLQRLDTATARVVSTVSIVATLLTGLGLFAAGLANLAEAARVLAIASVALAFLAVLLALTAQVFTVTAGLNNLVDVERWYLNRMQRRGPLAQGATVLLVAAAAAAGAATVITLTTNTHEPILAVTRTTSAIPTTPATSKLTIDATFRGLAPGQIASTTVTIDGTIVAAAAFGPAPDGTAARTLALDQIPINATAIVDARAGNMACTATIKPQHTAEIKCPAT